MCIFVNVIDFQKEIQQLDLYSKRIIGIDYGSHKIGIALSDEDRCIAFKQEILIGDWNNLLSTAVTLLKTCEKYNSNIVVIGFPKKLDGSLSENCKKIIQTAKLLDKEYVKKNNKNISILLFDERFTTKATISVFNTKIGKNFCKKNKTNDNKLDDAGAACIILNDVLTATNKNSLKSLK